MSDLPARHIFVSYSSRDRADDPDLVDQVFVHIRGLKRLLKNEFSVEIFIDQERLAAGDKWGREIERALASADLALLLVSPHFLDSDFIMEQEFPRLLVGEQSAGACLVPVLLHPCALGQIQWFAQAELRPRGKRALSEIAERAERDRVLMQLTTEVCGLLRAVGRPAGAPARDPAAAQAPRLAPSPPREVAGLEANRHEAIPHEAKPQEAARHEDVTDAPVRLLATTLLRELGEHDADALARRLVQGIARFTRLTGEALFRCVRFCIEFQLLMADEPAAPAALRHFLGEPIEDESAQRLVQELRRRVPAGDFSRTPVRVNSYFFSLTREREELWKRYFDAVMEAGVDEHDRERLATLCAIQVQYGFLAPQHLVAGLLSRFNDDWRPVLNAYQNAIPDPRRHAGAFESLQASQWNCWLVWGPSIPICTCSQWRGVYAFQYGYGDENNSLPVIDLGDGRAGEGRPGLLDPVTATFDAEGRGAKWVQMTGRLRWGPWLLREAGEGDGADRPDDHFDLAAADEIDFTPASSRRPAAPAQASLFREDGLQFRHDSDGILMQVETVERLSNDHRVYFSAYLWMIFLVASAADEPGIGPRLLRGRAWPRWPDSPQRREHVREARLWEQLLPVFVHANVADPEALAFQKRVLAQNAVALLQQVWERRAELFDAADVQAGIRFHLASASDYSGCGCPVRYPSGTSLVSLLHERLAREPDRAFADAVLLPPTGTETATRPPGLAGYFSSCHLPELVADYFDFVKPRGERRGGSS